MNILAKGLTASNKRHDRRLAIFIALYVVIGAQTVSGEQITKGSKRPAAASSQPTTNDLRWNPQWPRVRAWEYLATALSYGFLAYVQFSTYRSVRPKWEGGILFDDAVQRVLRLSNKNARAQANLASDILWGTAQAFPVLDAIAIGLISERDPDLTWQLLMIDAQVYGLAAFLSRAMHKTSRRTRPLVEHCKRDPTYDRSCGTSGAVAGFWSGHTAMPAAAAGLTCANHQYLPLYGGGWKDGSACAATIAMAAGTGLTRIMADRHYLSDVLVGFGVGFAIGYGIPTLLHYNAGWLQPKQANRTSAPRHTASSHLAFFPLLSAENIGLGVLSAF